MRNGDIRLEPPKNRTESLNRAIRYAYENALFYKRRGEIPVLSRIEDLQRLPFTTREDLKNSDPMDFLACPKTKVLRYGCSTGTGKKYSMGFVTKEDWLENCRTLYFGFAQVIGKEDVVMVAAPYELSFVAADFDRVLEMTGAATIAVSASHTQKEWERILGIMRETKVTVICCSATRILRLGLLAEELGLSPKKDFFLQKVICVGELLTPQKKRRIEELWGCLIYITYGMTEATSVAGPCKAGHLHLCESRYFFEIIDPDTGGYVKPGEVGELTLTSYNNKAMPLIRFRTGDRVRQTHCGGCFLSFCPVEHYGRMEDYYETESGRLYFYDIEELLLSCGGTGPLFRCACRDKRLCLWIEALPFRSWKEVKQEAENRFKESFRLPVRVDRLDRKAFLAQTDRVTKPGSMYFEKGMGGTG